MNIALKLFPLFSAVFFLQPKIFDVSGKAVLVLYENIIEYIDREYDEMAPAFYVSVKSFCEILASKWLYVSVQKY